MKNLLEPKKLIVLLLIAGVSLILSAFFIEHVLGAKPCIMCWWQRYIHWAITAICIIGFTTKKHILAFYGVTIASLSGFVVAIWQTLVQQKILPTPGCGATEDIMPLNSSALINSINNGAYTLPSCDKIDFTILGFSLANWNIIVMFAFMLVAGMSIWYNKNRG